jgi:hypothetical protein
MDLDSYDQPTILFLKGCFLSDCNNIEDMFEERIQEEYMNDSYYNINEVKYDKIPATFTSYDAWPKKTNLKCWSCDCVFHGVPVFIPGSIERSDTPGKVCESMDVMGNFCSWGCAAKYIGLRYTGSKKWDKMELLKILHKIFTSVAMDEIIEAPDKTEMEAYGGKRTQAEFMRSLETLQCRYMESIENNGMDYIRL